MRFCWKMISQDIVAICVVGAGLWAFAQPKVTNDASRPPSVRCDADPLTVDPDGSAKIIAKASSPTNRSLTYRFTTTAGEVKSDGTSVIFKAIRAAPGPVVVTCIVTDDHGAMASDAVRLNVTRGD